ncbi:MAG: hypothetical protein R6V10_02380 [bacterium]
MDHYKLVISDFHIGTGLLAEDGTLNPLEYFIFDPRLIAFLDYYSSGPYKNTDVELILNGDFLNTLQVDFQESFPTEISEELAINKVRKIVDGHPEVFDALRRFTATPHHRITYIAGNHDPGVLWPGVRNELNRLLETEIYFPGFNYTFDGIWIEHGHQYHPSNRFDTGNLFKKNKSGEVILNLPWGCLWVIEFLNQVKKERVFIDRVQPFRRYLLLGLVFDPLFGFPAITRLTLHFLRDRFRFKNLTDPVERRRSMQILRYLRVVPNLEYSARKILARPGYHSVIFAHNHQAAYRRFGKEKLYVNTGTWNDIIHLDIQNLGRQRRMTYAFIDYPDKKRPRVKLKLWKGTQLVEEDVIF